MFDNILKFVIAGFVKLMQEIILDGLYIGPVNIIGQSLGGCIPYKKQFFCHLVGSAVLTYANCGLIHQRLRGLLIE